MAQYTITIRSDKRFTVSTDAADYMGIATTDWRVVVKTVQEIVEGLMFDYDGADIQIKYV